VPGICDLLDRVVDDLAQSGVEHVLAEVDRGAQAGVLDVIHLGDVGGGVAHVNGSLPVQTRQHH